MKSDRKEFIARVILVAGIVFVVSVLLLPEVDASEDVSYSGPQIPYGTSKYVVNGYYFPPIPKGQVISIGITGFTPSDLLVTFYPQGGQQFGYPVLSVIPKNGSYLEHHTTTTSARKGSWWKRAQPRELIRANLLPKVRRRELNSSFHLVCLSAVFLVLATAVAAYYYTYAEKRWRKELSTVQGSPR